MGAPEQLSTTTRSGDESRIGIARAELTSRNPRSGAGGYPGQS